jgi:dihydrolipoamide dehydrogenase
MSTMSALSATGQLPDNHFDIVIIGSGPGGYIAAIRSAQLGYRTAIVEKYPVLGGTCTNVGCIPSKAMLDSTELYHSILHKASKKGIEMERVQLNFPQLIGRNRQVVRQNTEGLIYLMKKNRINVFYGTASFVNPHNISIHNMNGVNHSLSADRFIIATGSKPLSIPGVVIDKKRIISSTQALFLEEKPSSLIIIGGGVIGVEMASVYNRIGTQVTIVEYGDSLIPAMDKEQGRELQKILTEQGVVVHLKSKVQFARLEGDEVSVGYTDGVNSSRLLKASYCLVAAGRKPYTEGLGLAHTNIKLDEKGHILISDNFQTHEKNIYAIGDVVRGPMLAHKAEDEGVAVLDSIHGNAHTINYLRIPNVVYTWPEVASVGYTEEQLKDQGIAYRKGKFPFLASGRARASDDTGGFVKVLADSKYGEVLGVHIIGARAADLIAEAVLAMEFEITDQELGKISYAHPTFSETLKEAYLAASGRGSLNM